MPTEQWYYRLDGRAHGPFTSIQFEKLIRGKTVTPQTEVSLDGKNWRTLNSVLASISGVEPADPSPSELMNQATLLPGEVSLPPNWKEDLKKPR